MNVSFKQGSLVLNNSAQLQKSISIKKNIVGDYRLDEVVELTLAQKMGLVPKPLEVISYR